MSLARFWIFLVFVSTENNVDNAQLQYPILAECPYVGEYFAV